MERGGKSGEGGAEKEENLGEKLRRGVLLEGKRGGPCTPVLSWRLWAPPTAHDTIIRDYPFHPPSARKLAAALWEFQKLYFPRSKMHRGVSNAGAGADSRARRHQHHYNKLRKDKGLDLSHFLADNSTTSPDQVLEVFLFFFWLDLRCLIWVFDFLACFCFWVCPIFSGFFLFFQILFLTPTFVLGQDHVWMGVLMCMSILFFVFVLYVFIY